MNKICPVCELRERLDDVDLYEEFVTNYVDPQKDELDYSGFAHWLDVEFGVEAEPWMVEQHFNDHMMFQLVDDPREEADAR